MGERAFVLVPLADVFPEGYALGMDFSAQQMCIRDRVIRGMMI